MRVSSESYESTALGSDAACYMGKLQHQRHPRYAQLAEFFFIGRQVSRFPLIVGVSIGRVIRYIDFPLLFSKLDFWARFYLILQPVRFKHKDKGIAFVIVRCSFSYGKV